MQKHEDLEVDISAPDEKYPAHMLKITSKGHFSLSTGIHAHVFIHGLTREDIILIRDSLNGFLAGGEARSPLTEDGLQKMIDSSIVAKDAGDHTETEVNAGKLLEKLAEYII